MDWVSNIENMTVDEYELRKRELVSSEVGGHCADLWTRTRDSCKTGGSLWSGFLVSRQTVLCVQIYSFHQSQLDLSLCKHLLFSSSDW